MVVSGSSHTPVDVLRSAASTVNTMIPVYIQGSEQSVGSVVYRQQRTIDGDMFLEVRYRGITGLVPCRRATDVVHPDRGYVLEDGTLWFAEGQTIAPRPVVAELTDPTEG